eukprot:jgi/Chlat1/8039/Chrsp71S07509
MQATTTLKRAGRDVYESQVAIPARLSSGAVRRHTGEARRQRRWQGRGLRPAMPRWPPAAAGPLRRTVVCLLLTLLVVFHAEAKQQATSSPPPLTSVTALTSAMYDASAGALAASSPCVRLHDANGQTIGCSSPGPGRRLPTALVQRVIVDEDVTNIEGIRALLVPQKLLLQLLKRLESEPQLASRIAGILVETSADAADTPESFSTSDTFPQAEYSPYLPESKAWNPWGTGAWSQRIDFPVFLLDANGTRAMRQRAEENARRGYKHPAYAVEFDLVMQTAEYETESSIECLAAETCLPVGGYSVLSAMPPISAMSVSDKDIVLVLATMDSTALFHDFAIGADASISGLIAMLAAAEALSRFGSPDLFTKQVVFVALNAESWGYTGSRRFIHDLESNSGSVAGLEFDRITQVFEVGAVGQTGDVLYAHPTQRSRDGNTQEDAALRDMLDALHATSENHQLASSSNTSDTLPTVQVASERDNPGVPPSSLMTLLRKDPTIAGVYLAEFDTQYTNRYHWSHLDSAGNINLTSTTAVATVLARTVHALAASPPTSSSNSALHLTEISANATLVSELAECFLSNTPGMSCALSNHYITPQLTTRTASHYVGVLVAPIDPSQPASVPFNDMSRVVWNFLAEKTASGGGEGEGVVECAGACEGEGYICVGWRADAKGRCLNSTTKYVPAYSSSLLYDTNNARWTMSPQSRSRDDPVWTESYWQRYGVRAFMQDSARLEIGVLVGGVAVTTMSAVAVGAVTTRLLKWQKYA